MNKNIKIKICGMCNAFDADACARLGVDYIGTIFARGSPRFVDVGQAEEIFGAVATANPRVKKVGVFVDANLDFVSECVRRCALDVVQLHGSEDDSYIESLKRIFFGKIWKAYRLSSRADFDSALDSHADAIVADSYVGGKFGGTGSVSNWVVAGQLSKFRRTILAGGLSPENCADAAEKVSPWCLDFNSCVEISPREKDAAKIEKILNQRKIK